MSGQQCTSLPTWIQQTVIGADMSPISRRLWRLMMQDQKAAEDEQRRKEEQSKAKETTDNTRQEKR